MDASIGCQKAVQDLAGDNEEIREELWEIMGWFPSIEMMRNHVVPDQGHARGRRSVPSRLSCPTFRRHPLGNEGGATPTDKQRARWWMYRLSKMTTAAGSYTSFLEDGEGHRRCPAPRRPPTSLMCRSFRSLHRQKKKVVKQEVLDEAGTRTRRRRGSQRRR
ncbi:hypothetical protein ZWY2020_011917 [Hordeum vulgare]|nr:hypothetical protein ZWY2020_011917 [Hordeum vulgare]